jgi:predicted transposase YbfD/YdcC
VKVKKNQRKLRCALENTVKTKKPVASFHSQDIVRGRLEIRDVSVYRLQDGALQGWECVRTVVHVRRRFVRMKNYKTHQTDDSIYASNIITSNAEEMAGGIQSHWGIENILHWVKDVVMGEDGASARGKKGAASLALMRNFTFNLLKGINKSIKAAIEIVQAYGWRKIWRLFKRT